MHTHEYYMDLALAQAQKAFKKGEVPIGAIIVHNNKVVAQAYNNIERKNNSINHAEILTIIKASKKLKKWRLSDCTLYITLQPCLMCTGAIIQSRIKTVVYATDSNYLTEKEQKFIKEQYTKYKIEVVNNIEKEKSIKLLKQFFKNRRNDKKRLK